MATVAEQIAAEAARRNAEAEANKKIQEQPGPTVEKADLASQLNAERVKRQILANTADVKKAGEGGGVIEQILSQAAEAIRPSSAFTHGATLGLDVPISGLVAGISPWNHPDTTFGERFAGGEAAQRTQLGIDRPNTIAPGLQEIAGSVLSAGVAGAPERFAVEQAGGRALPAVQKGVLQSGAEAAAVGGGQGAVQGAANAEGDFKDRLLGGGRGALAGLLLGGTLGAGGRALQPDANVAAQRVAAADEFNLPLTRGQATGDINQQRTEQEMLHGARGDPAAREMAAQGARLETARGDAVEDIRTRFSPHRGGTQEESGQLLAESMRRRAERLRAVGGGRIDDALNSGVEIDVPALQGLGGRVQAALAGPNQQVPRHVLGVNTPVAAEAMDRIGSFMQTLPDDPTARISLAGVNQLRRNLLSLQANTGNQVDASALAAIKSEVDNWMTDVVGQQGAGSLGGGGATGPQEALDMLRAGNESYRRGSEISHPRGNVSPAQKNVAKLADPDAIGGDAVRMFKVNQRGGWGAEATRTARQIREQFGADSPQIQRVRDIATVSILDGGPERVATQIDNFLTTNRAGADTIFTPEQIAELERFRDVSRSLVPDNAAMNRGQSGYASLKAILKSSLIGGGAMLGSQIGGDVAGMSSIVMPAVGAIGGDAFGRAMGQRAINKALQPIPGGGAMTPTMTNIARTVPGQMPDRETLTRLMSGF